MTIQILLRKIIRYWKCYIGHGAWGIFLFIRQKWKARMRRRAKQTYSWHSIMTKRQIARNGIEIEHSSVLMYKK
jgi:hypothetical protein